MKAQNIEQALAAHIAQQDAKGEGGNRRAKHHQHVYFIFHNGPSIQSFSSPIVRRSRTFTVSFARKRQCVIVTDESPALTLVSVAE
jgi:hypothetical protein